MFLFIAMNEIRNDMSMYVYILTDGRMYIISNSYNDQR